MNNALRMELRSLIRDVINGNGNAVETGAVADQVLDRLWQMYDDGEHWVMWWIREYTREGIRRRVIEFVKESSGTVLLSSSGSVVDLPTHVSVVTRRDDGKKSYQLKLWWELEWPDFLSMVAGRARQRRILTNQIKGFNEVTRLRDRFPESKTPGEACSLAGVDPKSFELEETLAAI